MTGAPFPVLEHPDCDGKHCSCHRDLSRDHPALRHTHPQRACAAGAVIRHFDVQDGVSTLTPNFSGNLERVWHEDRYDLIAACMADVYVRHDGAGTRRLTPKQYAEEIVAAKQYRPNTRVRVYEHDITDDRAWFRFGLMWTYAITSAPRCRAALQVWRIEQGKLAESWLSLLEPRFGMAGRNLAGALDVEAPPPGRRRAWRKAVTTLKPIKSLQCGDGRDGVLTLTPNFISRKHLAREQSRLQSRRCQECLRRLGAGAQRSPDRWRRHELSAASRSTRTIEELNGRRRRL